MIIKYFDTCFSIKMEHNDWYSYSARTLIELLKKSIPKSHRRFDWTEKVWIVSNQHKKLLDTIKVFTDEEELEGLQAFKAFMRLFD